MVKLGILPWGKSLRACSRLTVSYSLFQTARATWGPECHHLAYADP
jgi:hypothetical protein